MTTAAKHQKRTEHNAWMPKPIADVLNAAKQLARSVNDHQKANYCVGCGNARYEKHAPKCPLITILGEAEANKSL